MQSGKIQSGYVSSYRPAAPTARPTSAVMVIRCELTDTYSPAAMDIDPATSPAMAAVGTVDLAPAVAATPMARLATETMPSSAPRTAARSQAAFPPLCCSGRAGTPWRLTKGRLGLAVFS